MKEKVVKCLYCGSEIKEAKTIRKLFCSDLCRVKNNQEKKFEKAIAELLNIPELKEQKRQAVKELMDFGKTNLPTKERLLEIISRLSETEVSENKNGKWAKKEELPKPPESGNEYFEQQTEKMQPHKLWEKGDPKENSTGFFLKYGVSTYNELEKQLTQ